MWRHLKVGDSVEIETLPTAPWLKPRIVTSTVTYVGRKWLTAGDRRFDRHTGVGDRDSSSYALTSEEARETQVKRLIAEDEIRRRLMTPGGYNFSPDVPVRKLEQILAILTET